MKFEFNDILEYDLLWGSVHDSIVYWKKVLQDAQGKITLAVDGNHTHYSEDYIIDQIGMYANLLKQIESTPHPEWNGEKEVMIENCDYHSHMVEKSLKMVMNHRNQAKL